MNTTTKSNYARVQTVSGDGLSYGSSAVKIEDTNPSAFAFELAKTIENQIQKVASGKPVEAHIELHIRQ